MAHAHVSYGPGPICHKVSERSAARPGPNDAEPARFRRLVVSRGCAREHSRSAPITSVPKSTAKGLTRAASPLSLIFGKACHAHTREHLFREGSLMTCTRGLTTIPNGSPQNLRALLLKLSSTHSCFPDLTADCCRSESSRISVIGWLGRWSTVNRKMAIFAQPS